MSEPTLLYKCQINYKSGISMVAIFKKMEVTAGVRGNIQHLSYEARTDKGQWPLHLGESDSIESIWQLEIIKEPAPKNKRPMFSLVSHR